MKQLEQRFDAAMCGVGGFEPTPHIAVAVSGGADSMALCVLAQRWALPLSGRVTALIVDHRLRAESSQEAEQVAQRIRGLGVDAQILVLDGLVGCTSVQDNARKLRYQSMLEWCENAGVLHLLTGHHADDERETLWLRQARGTGLRGLCGIPTVSYRQHVRIVRPLLCESKQACIDYLQSENTAWVEDPSNVKPVYARNRIRALMASYPDEFPSADRSIKLVDNLQRSERFILAKLHEWMAENVQTYPVAVISLRLSAYEIADEELRFRVLSYSLTCLSVDGSEPRFDDVLALDALLCAPIPACKRTLNGCMAVVDNSEDNIVLYREIARMESPKKYTHLAPFVWDGPYHVSGQAKGSGAWFIAPLGASGVVQLRKQKFSMPSLPVEVLRTFPAIWEGGGLDRLVAVPHMGYYGDDVTPNDIKIRWQPVRTLAD